MSYSDADRMEIKIMNDRIYRHQTIRTLYTTYDKRRDYDTLNPSRHANIMVLAPDEEASFASKQHPYWYARIFGIFHADVLYTGAGAKSGRAQRVDFLWVRWYDSEMSDTGGFIKRRLPRIKFTDTSDRGAFGFLDPSTVIRACHLIPAFAYGRVEDDLPSGSPCRIEDKKDGLRWKEYSVGMWVSNLFLFTLR